jgi:ABC-type Zn2+ transport system substrate-binding protein/surface adhesin
MLVALKRLALVMVMAVLPVQGFAAVVIPVCQNDPTHASSVAESDHRHADGHDHGHDSSAPDHGHPIAAGDYASDHCSTVPAFAILVMISTSLAPAATAERSWFPAAHRSGFIPEQPQRPPLV